MRIYSSSSDMSDMYNNLKATWDSLMEAAEHASPQGFHIAVVNTKNWYMKGTDLWAEFGKEAPFGRKFSSKDSVKILAVGSTPSFDRRAVYA
jgi:hypothetical protein